MKGYLTLAALAAGLFYVLRPGEAKAALKSLLPPKHAPIQPDFPAVAVTAPYRLSPIEIGLAQMVAPPKIQGADRTAQDKLNAWYWAAQTMAY